MALKKTIIEKNGITTEYHKIKFITLSDKKEDKYNITVGVGSYVNEAIRQESEEYVVVERYYELDVLATEVENESIYKILYNELKKTKDFEGAENC